MYLLVALAGGAMLTAQTVPAAPAPSSAPVVEVLPAGEDACFAAARDRQPDPASCDVVIQSAGVDTPTLAATHNNRGLILAAMNQLGEALADFETALELVPDLAQARINRANMLFQLARYPEALAAYDEALAGITVHRHIALFNRGLTYGALGNVVQARDDIAAARRLFANSFPGAPRPGLSR
jgi:tetratricopeptide (TPR) repeat protein